MSIKSHTRFYSTLECDEGKFTLVFANILEGSEVVKAVGKYMVIGYLNYDEGSWQFDPSDCGDWKIYSSHRDRYDDHGPMQEALGLDQNWEPDIDQFEDDAVIDCAKAGVYQLIAKHGGGMQVIEFESLDTDVGIVTVALPSGKTDTIDFQVYWKPDERYRYVPYVELDGMWEQRLFVQERQMELWHAARESGEIGNKWAIPLNVYEHSNIHYSTGHEWFHDQWDTARGGAVWVPNQALIKEIEKLPEAERKAYAFKVASGCAEEYTDWSNGSVFDTVVEWFENTGTEEEPVWTQIDYDVCGGHIGYEYAEECLKEAVDEKVAELQEESNEQPV